MKNIHQQEWLNLAQRWLYSDPDMASIYYRKVLAENPCHRLSLLGLAKAYLVRDGFEEAIEALEMEISLHPGDLEGMQLLADLYLHKRYYWRALSLYRKALQQHPNHSGIQKDFAILDSYMKTGRRERIPVGLEKAACAPKEIEEMLEKIDCSDASELPIPAQA